jgi:hypothetical protein
MIVDNLTPPVPNNSATIINAQILLWKEEELKSLLEVRKKWLRNLIEREGWFWPCKRTYARCSHPLQA